MRSAQPGTGGHAPRPSTGTLPAISEDGVDFNPPPVPQRGQGYGAGQTIHPWSTMNFVRAFERSANRSPPSYSFKSSSLSEEDNEKAPKIREKKQIAKRGGWKRLTLAVLIAVLCIVGLIVGLVVGLRNKSKNSNSSGGSSSGPASSINITFPAGSYSVQTYLDIISTNCTSNPATWRCYPYSTYSESPAAAAAQFDWLIQPSSEGSNTYTVSSSNNPFAPSFTNTTLKLVDAGLSTERYTFQINTNKPVIPTIDISGSNVQSTCYFNTTSFEAELYTKMDNSNHSGNNSTSNGAYVPWPYAASIKQVAVSGSNVPECFTADGKKVGDFEAAGSGEECSCDYQNYEL